ncbi:MAG: 30S ribosomal protein S6--L-glutamate ligase [Chitinophagales bacterium]|nr:30S ribosomal protein S6--L-glutamate ligase [Chitinophagales bacterium]MDW8428283.1 30S ribosomal protein S6--L-glutamate ligase [Chitinophagales bacterium]
MRIAILSRSDRIYSTARLRDACITKGHDPIILDYRHCYMTIEQGQPKIFFKGAEVKGIEAVIPRIGASYTFYGTALVRQFEMKRIFSVNESQAITRSRDKLRSLQLLARAGLNIPKTVFAHDAHNVDELIAMVGGPPVVIKVIEGTQGKGVILADTLQVARSTIEAFWGQNINILVQEYIHEAGGADLRVLVVGDQVIAAMRRVGRKGEFRSNLHRGGKGEAVAIKAEEAQLALQACHTLGLGVAGVDIIRSARGPVVLEVNSSPGLKGIEAASGVDVAAAIVAYAEAHAPAANVHDSVGY